ncbi:hypothetical protein V8C44DRAFT_13726 [Trichoderma aethiopicum]
MASGRRGLEWSAAPKQVLLRCHIVRCDRCRVSSTSSSTVPACSCVPQLWMLAYQSGITVYHRLVYQTSCVRTAAKARVLYERAIEQYLVSRRCGRASTRQTSQDSCWSRPPTGKGLVLSRLSLARSEAHRGPKFWPGLLRALHERLSLVPAGLIGWAVAMQGRGCHVVCLMSLFLLFLLLLFLLPFFVSSLRARCFLPAHPPLRLSPFTSRLRPSFVICLVLEKNENRARDSRISQFMGKKKGQKRDGFLHQRKWGNFGQHEHEKMPSWFEVSLQVTGKRFVTRMHKCVCMSRPDTAEKPSSPLHEPSEARSYPAFSPPRVSDSPCMSCSRAPK